MTTARNSEPDFPHRIAVTLGVLAIFWIGTQIPLPGIDASRVSPLSQGTLGAAMSRLSIFALGVTPLLTVLMVVELATLIWPDFREAKPLHSPRVLWFALAIAAFQGWGIAIGLESVTHLVPEPGIAFRLGVIATLVAATAMLAWLAIAIKRHGVGHGLWLLLAAPMLLEWPITLLAHIDLMHTHGPDMLMATLAFLAASIIALTALVKRDPSLLVSDRLIWPAVLTPAVVAMLLVLPRHLFTNEDPALTAAGSPLRLILLVVITAGIMLLRERSLAAPAAAEPQPSRVRAAVALAAIAAGGDVLVSRVPLPASFEGSAVIMLVALALAIAHGLGQAKP